MAEFFLAIIGIIFAIGQLVAALCIHVLAWLGFSVAHLAEKQGDHKTRSTARKVIVTLSPVILFVCLAAAVFLFFNWRAKVNAARERQTKSTPHQQATQLSLMLDEEGHFVEHPSPTLDVEDAWRNVLRVEYRDTILGGETVFVLSDGLDGKPDTSDDLTASISIGEPHMEVIEDLFEAAKRILRDKLWKKNPVD